MSERIRSATKYIVYVPQDGMKPIDWMGDAYEALGDSAESVFAELREGADPKLPEGWRWAWEIHDPAIMGTLFKE